MLIQVSRRWVVKQVIRLVFLSQVNLTAEFIWYSSTIRFLWKRKMSIPESSNSHALLNSQCFPPESWYYQSCFERPWAWWDGQMQYLWYKYQVITPRSKSLGSPVKMEVILETWNRACLTSVMWYLNTFPRCDVNSPVLWDCTFRILKKSEN